MVTRKPPQVLDGGGTESLFYRGVRLHRWEDNAGDAPGRPRRPEDGENHGYLDIYDSGSNPTGYWRNPANGTPPLPALTNAQMGAIINFQLVVRDGSMGVHNYPYIKKLLENSIEAL